MAAAGAAAWLGGLGGLLAPRATLLAGVVAGPLALVIAGRPGLRRAIAAWLLVALADRKSVVSGKSASVSVAIGRRRIIKNKESENYNIHIRLHIQTTTSSQKRKKI